MKNTSTDQPARSHPLESYGDSRNIARIFYWFIALIALGLAIGAVILIAANTPGTAFGVTAIAVGFLPVLASAYFVHRQKFEWAATLLAIILMVLITVLATNSLGIHHISNFAFPVILVIASMVMRKRVMAFLTLFAIGCVAWLVFGELSGAYTPSTLVRSVPGDFFTASVIIILTAAMVRLITESLFQTNTRLQKELGERKQAEEILQLFQYTNDHARDAIQWLNREGGFEYVNEQACRSLGYTREELMRLHLWDIDPIYSKERWDENWENYQGDQQSGSEIVESLHRRKDGSDFPVEMVSNHLWFGDRELHVAIVRDITERKQAEQKIQLRLNELVTVNAVSQVAASQLEIDTLIELTGERLRQISNVDCLFIALCDYQNNVIKFPYYRYHGVIVESAPLSMGQGLTSRVVKDRKPLIIDQDYEQRSEEMGVVREIFPGYPDRRPKTWMGIPLQVGDQVVGALGIENFEREHAFNDDDVRLWETIAANFAVAIQNAQLYTAAQQELVERQKLIEELEVKNAELERFTYTVSHDLKAPLITINGFVGYLEEDATSSNVKRLKDDIQRIRGAVAKMQRLLNELLELSRVGRLVNPPEEVPFEEIVHEALDNVHGLLEERGVTVTLSPNLPAVYGDRQRLIEVLQNLIENATKFMGNQPNPQIEIGQRGEDTERGKPVFFVKIMVLVSRLNTMNASSGSSTSWMQTAREQASGLPL